MSPSVPRETTAASPGSAPRFWNVMELVTADARTEAAGRDVLSLLEDLRARLAGGRARAMLRLFGGYSD